MKSTAKPFPLETETSLIRTIFDGLEVYSDLTSEDFREMAKFDEQTNIAGLPVHPIARPVRDLSVREFAGRFEDLPDANPLGPIASLRELLSVDPCLAVRGSLAGECSRPLRILAVVPQSQAHLAHGLSELLWPEPPQEPTREEKPEPADLYLVQVPYGQDRFILHVPASKLVLVAGIDDLRPGLLVAIEAAHRLWSARTAQHLEQAPAENADSHAHRREHWEEIRLLPGGCFPFQTREASGSTLVFTAESIPDEWERIVSERVKELSSVGEAEILLAGSEPWVAEGGAWVCPLWRNPPLPARALADAPRWGAAAIDPDALPFGVHVQPSGEIDLSAGRDDAFIVVPRRRLPEPFLNSDSRSKVKRVLTHGFAKADAMELWARGFPAPEVIYGSSCG